MSEYGRGGLFSHVKDLWELLTDANTERWPHWVVSLDTQMRILKDVNHRLARIEHRLEREMATLQEAIDGWKAYTADLKSQLATAVSGLTEAQAAAQAAADALASFQADDAATDASQLAAQAQADADAVQAALDEVKNPPAEPPVISEPVDQPADSTPVAEPTPPPVPGEEVPAGTDVTSDHLASADPAYYPPADGVTDASQSPDQDVVVPIDQETPTTGQ